MDIEQIYKQLSAIDEHLTAASGNLYGVSIPDDREIKHAIEMLDIAADMTSNLTRAIARQFQFPYPYF